MKNKSGANVLVDLTMFLFRMHSVGSVRSRPSAANALIRWWNNGDPDAAATSAEVISEATTSEAETSAPPTSEVETSGLNQEPNEIEEDVVVIQEEEMVLVRKEHQEQAPAPHEAQDPPQPQCIEPEPTVSAPAPSKFKPKKKQQTRR